MKVRVISQDANGNNITNETLEVRSWRKLKDLLQEEEAAFAQAEEKFTGEGNTPFEFYGPVTGAKWELQGSIKVVDESTGAEYYWTGDDFDPIGDAQNINITESLSNSLYDKTLRLVESL